MTDGYRWVTAEHGRIPDGAVPHGYDDDGEPLWVCRMSFNGGVQVGKVRPGLGRACIAWGGEEYGVEGEYEVLMDRGVWGIATGDDLPDDAYPAGREHHGAALFVARAAVDGNNLTIGKVRPGFVGANIGYGNEEHTVHAYEVLLKPSVTAPSPVPPPLPVAAAQPVVPAQGVVVDGNRITVTVTVDLGGR